MVGAKRNAEMRINMELFKQIQDNLSFRNCLFDMVFNITYNTDGESYKAMIDGYKHLLRSDKNLQQECYMVAEPEKNII